MSSMKIGRCWFLTFKECTFVVGRNNYLVLFRLIPCSESEKNTNFKYNGHEIDNEDIFA